MEPGQVTKAAATLVGHKMYMDYLALVAQGISTEPERFFDVWMDRYVKEDNSTVGFSEGIWRIFMQRIVENRRKRD